MNGSGFRSSSLLLVVVLSTGCGTSSQPAKPAPSQTSATSGDDHHHGSGPHGGTVADWGHGDYHVEFTVDHEQKESTVYVLGDDGKTPAPIHADKLVLRIREPEFQVELMPQPLEGESEGTSSRFVGHHDNLGIVREFAGTISGKVDGKPFSGDFKEVAEANGHP